jgi:hypothetical protein
MRPHASLPERAAKPVATDVWIATTLVQNRWVATSIIKGRDNDQSKAENRIKTIQ